MVAAGLLGRLPLALVPYALLLSLAPDRGFGFAGAVAGSFSITQAIASPGRGRLIDRLGARPVLLACGVVQPLALLLVAATIHAHAGDEVVVAAVIVAAVFTAPVSAIARRIWALILDDEPVLQTAYAFESVGGEAIFIAGTALAGSLATFGVTSLVLAAACSAVGVLGLAAQRPVRMLPTSRAHLHWLGPLRDARFRMLLLVVVFNFATFGALDVGVAAFARHVGLASLTGLLLGVFGAGSLVGGLVQGGRDWHGSLPRQQTVWLGAMTAGLAALVFAPDVLVLGALLAAAGLTVAPVANIQMTLGTRMAPTGATTEALAWVAAVYNVGFALGNAVAGQTVQHAGIRPALFAAASFAAVATALSSIDFDRRPSGRRFSFERIRRVIHATDARGRSRSWRSATARSAAA